MKGEGAGGPVVLGMGPFALGLWLQSGVCSSLTTECIAVFFAIIGREGVVSTASEAAAKLFRDELTAIHRVVVGASGVLGADSQPVFVAVAVQRVRSIGIAGDTLLILQGELFQLNLDLKIPADEVAVVNVVKCRDRERIPTVGIRCGGSDDRSRNSNYCRFE